MNYVRILTISALVMVFAGICDAQWYQGYSGGRGGSKFDFWTESGGLKDMSAVTVLQDGNNIRCIIAFYRGPSPGKTLRVDKGFCDKGPSALAFNGYGGISLGDDEYILGISGTYSDHINSIVFYTNKTKSKVLGGQVGSDTFGYTAPHGQMIVGFFGRAGDNLDAIGVVYAPCTPNKKPCV